MDKTVPAPAALILNKIREVEVGTASRAGYDVIYANKQDKLPKPITQMTIAELQGHQSKGWPAKSTASGGYQFMKATLMDLRGELSLKDTQVFEPNLQDRLGYHLLLRRGYLKFAAGTMSRTAFGLNLAKEWASFPVLAATQGAKRKVTRGYSYYDGDGLNKSLVTPAEIEKLLDDALALREAPPAQPVNPPIPTGEPLEEHEQTIAPIAKPSWLIKGLIAAAIIILILIVLSVVKF